MDKLEKALQKARSQRAATPAPTAPAKPPARPTAGGGVELDEDVLTASRIVAHHSRGAEADTFRLLRTQCLRAMESRGARTMAVTSPHYGDGKTTVALNLAVSIAQDLKQTVLLVDLDLRKPSVRSYLGLSQKTGLTDYLAGRSGVADCLIRLPFERITVLPAGDSLALSSEILGSPQMAALARELRNRYPDRLIIYDMPPLLAQDDPLTFLPHIDCVLLVARHGETPVDDIKRSLDILTSKKTIGIVLNDQYRFALSDFIARVKGTFRTLFLKGRPEA